MNEICSHLLVHGCTLQSTCRPFWLDLHEPIMPATEAAFSEHCAGAQQHPKCSNRKQGSSVNRG